MNRIRSNWRSWAGIAVLLVVYYVLFTVLNALMVALFNWRDASYRTDIGSAFGFGVLTAMFVLPLLRRPLDVLYRRFTAKTAKS